MVGSWIRYRDTRELWQKGTYKDGKKDGSWVSYHANGQLFSKGTYKNGKEDGSWIWYRPGRRINQKYSGTYKNGVKVK